MGTGVWPWSSRKREPSVDHQAAHRGAVPLVGQCGGELDDALHPTDAPEGLLGQPYLQPSLLGRGHVLPAAAAAAVGDVGARWRHAMGARLDDLAGQGLEHPRLVLGDLGEHSVAGDGAPHEDHPPVGGMGDAVASAGDVVHGQLEVDHPLTVRATPIPHPMRSLSRDTQRAPVTVRGWIA